MNWKTLICFIGNFIICYFTGCASQSSTTISTTTGGGDDYDFFPFPEEDNLEAEKAKWIVGDIFQRIRFFMVHSTQMNDSQEVKIGNVKSLKLAKFDKAKPLKILIHGFIGECVSDNFPGTIINAYFKQRSTLDFNLICLDWAELSHVGHEINMRLYQLSMNYALVVGQRLAQFIKFLRDQNITASLSDIHIVGYSLGAHIAGFAGYHIQKHYNQRIGRITGLDPAGPLYDKKSLEAKLDKTDADFVDIIHTNAGKLGIDGSIGHVDFYPNGGQSQPQCQNTGDISADLYEAVAGICSHQIVPKYYARSILTPNFKACKCESWEAYERKACGCNVTSIFGEYCKPGTEGSYYLSTRNPVPSSTTPSYMQITTPKID